MQIQPYLFFEGVCEQAISFYQEALGAKVTMMMRFSESPEPCPGAVPEKIMHASFVVGETEVMASDGMCKEGARFEGFGLSLAVSSEAEAERYFNALADGGEVQMPLEKTFWSPKFGMVRDRFGVFWLINVVPA